MNYETTTTKNKSEKEPFSWFKGRFIFTQTFKTNPVLQETLRSEDVS